MASKKRKRTGGGDGTSPQNRKGGRPSANDSDSCPIDGGKANLGESFWVSLGGGRQEICKIERIQKSDRAFFVTVRVFKRAKGYVPRRWHANNLGEQEYVLTDEKKIVVSSCLVDKKTVLPWPEHAQKPSRARRDEPFYRFEYITQLEWGNPLRPVGGLDSTAAMRCFCRGDCYEHFHPDYGYSYCEPCRRTTIDEHLCRGGFFLSEGDGDLLLVSRTTNSTKPAQCHKCKTTFPSHDIGPATPSSPPDYFIALDVGAGRLRLASGTSLDQSFSIRDYLSELFVPKQGDATLGREAVGRAGGVITPVKRLFLPDERTLSVLESAGPDRFQAIHNVWKSFFEEFLRWGPAANANVWKSSDKKLFLWIGVAFPCCFDPTQRSNFLSALSDCGHNVRVFALAEPVAALYAIQDAHPEMVPDKCVVVDAGATTIDLAVARVRGNTLTVERESGVDYGTDDPEVKVAQFVERHSTWNVYYPHCLGVVRLYGNGVKVGRPELNSVRYGVEISGEYDKATEDFYDRLNADLPGLLAGSAEKVDKVILCGAGARSRRFRAMIEDKLPGKDIKYYNAPDQVSHVLKGIFLNMKRIWNERDKIHCSPVSICLKQDKEGKSGKELLVLVQKNQALEHPKLPDLQIQVDKPIMFKMDLADGDTRLEFKACFRRIKCTANTRGFLIADEAPCSFYDIGTCTLWSARERSQKGLQILEILPDVTANTVMIRALLLSMPEDETIQEIERHGLDDIKSKWRELIIDENYIVVSLNLNEDPSLAGGRARLRSA